VPSIDAACDRAYDFVAVATKSIPELSRTPTVLAPLLDAAYSARFGQPVYVIMQNGLDVERDLYEALRDAGHAPRIVSTAIHIGARLDGPDTLVQSHFDRMTLGVYRYDDPLSASVTPDETAFLSAFASLVVAGGSAATVVPDIQRLKFAKNLWNIAFSSAGVLTRAPLDALFSPPAAPAHPPPAVAQGARIAAHTLPALRAALLEAVRVGHALGWADDAERGLSAQTVDDLLAGVAAVQRRSSTEWRASMLIDVQEDRPIEVEVIFGAVFRLARKHGVETPRVDLMYAMLLVVQNRMLQKIGLEQKD